MRGGRGGVRTQDLGTVRMRVDELQIGVSAAAAAIAVCLLVPVLIKVHHILQQQLRTGSAALAAKLSLNCDL